MQDVSGVHAACISVMQNGPIMIHGGRNAPLRGNDTRWRNESRVALTLILEKSYGASLKKKNRRNCRFIVGVTAHYPVTQRLGLT